MSINLAAQPFENRRPLTRVKWLLLLLGVLTWGLAALKYWDYAAGSSEETRAQLQAVEAEISEINAQLNQAEQVVAAADLAQRNARMQFLNAKLGERAFPWSRLFHDLGRVQPNNVRLHRLTPTLEVDEDSGLPGFVSLALDGSARHREAWYRFVDGLFKHPRFAAPRMISENQDEGQIAFRLDVAYLTDLRQAPAEPNVMPAGGATAAMQANVNAAGARATAMQANVIPAGGRAGGGDLNSNGVSGGEQR